MLDLIIFAVNVLLTAWAATDGAAWYWVVLFVAMDAWFFVRAVKSMRGM